MQKYSCFYRSETLEPDEFGPFYLADEVDDEIARLRKAIVWAMRASASLSLELGRVYYERGYRVEFSPWDGTDESLIETLCRLAQQERE